MKERGAGKGFNIAYGPYERALSFRSVDDAIAKGGKILPELADIGSRVIGLENFKRAKKAGNPYPGLSLTAQLFSPLAVDVFNRGHADGAIGVSVIENALLIGVAVLAESATKGNYPFLAVLALPIVSR